MLKPKFYQGLKNVFEKLLFLCARNKHEVEKTFNRQNYYEEQYKNQEWFRGEEPHDLTVRSLEYLPANGQVVDLGAGEGKDALFLTSKGFEVTAVDIAHTGLQKLKERAIENDLPIKTKHIGIKEYITSDEVIPCDGIICINSLQFLNKQDIGLVVDSMQEKTKPGGINVIESFIADSEAQKKQMIAQGRYFFDEGELKKRYENKGWEILEYEEKYGEYHSHGEGEPEHRHYHVRLIAKKK